jgi:hypothetical protein
LGLTAQPAPPAKSRVSLCFSTRQKVTKRTIINGAVDDDKNAATVVTVRLLLRLIGSMAAANYRAFCQPVITMIVGTPFVFPRQPLPATQAPLCMVSGVASDATGNLFVVDPDNDLVPGIAPEGTLSKAAANGMQGSSGGGGLATSASLRLILPSVAADSGVTMGGHAAGVLSSKYRSEYPGTSPHGMADEVPMKPIMPMTRLVS